MERSARIVLRRSLSRKVVIVRSFTVGRFRLLAEAAGTHAVLLSSRLKRVITKDDLLHLPLGAREWSMVADIVCPDESPGWFVPWFRPKRGHCANLTRLIVAIGDVNDWKRILLEINLDGEPRTDGGNLDGDIARLCLRFPGTTPFDFYRQDLIEFYDMIRGQIAAAPRELVAKPVPMHQVLYAGVGTGEKPSWAVH